MIDVVFLLLIFFVCAASFQVVEDVLPTRLPSTGVVESAALPPEIEDLGRVVIRLHTENGRTRFQVNEDPYDGIDELHGAMAKLAEVAPEIPVILDVDPRVPMGSVIDVYDLCRVVGFETVNFAASKSP